MNYPKLKCEDKKNTKICSVKHKQMNKMREEGYDYTQIAEKFEVSQRTAWIHTAPSELVERSKKKRREAMRIEHKEKYDKDPNYRKKLLTTNMSVVKNRRKIDPQFRKYESSYAKEIQDARILKHPRWSYACAYGRHNGSNYVVQCQNQRGNCKCPCHF